MEPHMVFPPPLENIDELPHLERPPLATVLIARAPIVVAQLPLGSRPFSGMISEPSSRPSKVTS